MDLGRRNFLKTTAFTSAATIIAGSSTAQASWFGSSTNGSMQGFACAPIKNLRVGIIGLGMRGPGAVQRMASIEGNSVVALCDLYEARVKSANAMLKRKGKPEAKEFFGEDAWKKLCESDLDLVYIATPWAWHTPMAVYAMEHGKHTVIEVPSAMSIDECWQLVETSERTRKHCMQLENCCYDQEEMMSLNMARQGVFGTIIHGEGAYIHDLRSLNYQDPLKGGYQGYWRLKWNQQHNGNPYPTHGLGPVCQCMNINRGDKMDYLVSMSTNQFGMSEYAEATFGADSWQAKNPAIRGDMNNTLIRTTNGRTILIQHDVTSPRPYDRIHLLSGTKGIFRRYPLRIAIGANTHGWLNDEQLKEIKAKYTHPLWRDNGEAAKKAGGHGGMDFLMELRLSYCLQNGLPLDMDVYDAATWCSLCELSERSVNNRSRSMDIPDFTRGNWKTAKPLDIVNV